MGTCGVRRNDCRLMLLFVGALTVGPLGMGDISALAADVPEKDQEVPLVVLEPVKVEGQKIENEEDVKRNLARTPASTVLIEEKNIVESRQLHLFDVLQFAPGVLYRSRFGADEGQFQIRGTSLRNNFHHRGVNILINGIYFGDADGFSDFESIELMAYQRIEIYKGANALRYGANSIGGAINFVPRTGYQASILQMRGEAGSFGLVMGQVSSGKVTEPFKVGQMDTTADYYISVSGNRQDGFQSNSQQARERINANFGLQLGTHQEIRAYFLQGNIAERIPGSLTNAQLFQDPRQAGGQTPGANPAGGNFFACNLNNQICNYGRYYQIYRIGVAYHNEFAANQYFEVIPYYSYQYLDHPIFQTIKQDNNNVGGEVRYVNTNSLLGFNNSVVVGLQTRYLDQHQQRFVNINGNNGSITQNALLKAFYFGLYGEEQLDVNEKFTVVAGVRFDDSSRWGDIQNYNPVGAPVQTAPSTPGSFTQPLRNFNHVSPKFGFVYKVTPTAQVYGNVSQAYEAPLNLELNSAFNPDGSPNTTGFLDLDAQWAWQYELGWRGTTTDKRATWDLTVYDLEMRKEILTNVVNNTNTFVNANNTRHTGIEAGGGLVVTRGLFAKGPEGEADQVSTRFAFTWQRFIFTQPVFGAFNTGGPVGLIAKEGNKVAGAPVYSLSYELRYDHPTGWWIAPNMEWLIAGFYTDYANTVKNPAYFITNLRAGYNITKNLSLYAQGYNLTNKTYAGAVVVNDPFNRFANPSQLASGYAGVEWKF